MAKIAEVWVPAFAVRFQHSGPSTLPGQWAQERPKHSGFSCNFALEAGELAWLHFPVATPVMLPNVGPLYLDEVSILWATKGGARLSWATIHHGGSERHELMPCFDHRSGSHLTGLGEENKFVIRPRLEARFGVQICVLVTATDAAGEISLAGAGASFHDTRE